MVQLGSWSRITAKYTKMDPDYMAERHREMIGYLRNREEESLENAVHKHIRESFENFTSTFYAEEDQE